MSAAPESSSTSRLVRRGEGMAPADEPRSYYGKPVINQPVWTWEIPTYFFAGGLAGGSALLAAVADRGGRPALARAARRVGAAGALASPPLLIADLGRPARFHHMLRIVKPTSPMSVGSWLLAVFVPAHIGSAVLSELAALPRLQRLLQGAAAGMGPAMATYTAVLFSDTAVPVWHEARGTLPFVFGGSAVASAGAAALLSAPADELGPARRLALSGALVELGATKVMERQLDGLAEPYHSGVAGRWSNAAKAMSAVGGGLLWASTMTSRRRAAIARAGAALLLAGSACGRWAVYKAGFQSANDPKYTVEPQRRRIRERADAEA